MATTVALRRRTAASPAATPTRGSTQRALRTLASRRAALTAHNPRQIAVPMLTRSSLRSSSRPR